MRNSFNSFRTWAAWLCTLTYLNTVTLAGAPVDFHEVVTVTPSRVIEHEVDLKGPFDDEAVEKFLNGPQLFSHAVGVEARAVTGHKAYLNWYKIVQPANETRQKFSVRDSLRGDDTYEVTIEESAFLLSPAQRVTTGPPSPVPDGLNYFVAYRIVNASPLRRNVKLNGTFGPGARTTIKAVFLCLPVEEWHHDEHFPVKKPQECLVVYELLPSEQEVSVTTIDQFGLNKLDTRDGKWLCVRASVLKGIPSAVE